MKELNLDEIKKIEIDILRGFARYCRENELKFYLSNGTLLGAVKYGGFIPWDDDVDVLMPREDYDRFIQEFDDPGELQLLERTRTPRFAYPFAKLCNRNTVCEEYNLDNGLKMGLNIDIFPIDVWASSFEEAKEQSVQIKKAMNSLGYSKTKKYVPNSRRGKIGKMIRCCVHPLYKIAGARYYCEMIKNEALKHRGKDEKYVGCVIWPVYGEKEILPPSVFADSKEVVFEGDVYPAPVGFDEYLRSLYGEYREEPPESKRKTHHNFKAFRL